MDRLKRNFCFALSGALASSCALAGRKDTLPSKIYQFDDSPVRNAGNLIFRGILDDMIFEGCHLSLHESDLAPRTACLSGHTGSATRRWCSQRKACWSLPLRVTRTAEGSVLFAGSNDEHGICNPESTQAKYFVLALGSENE